MTAKSRAEAVLFAATLIWGSTFTGVKLILGEVPAIQMVFWRMGFAALVILLIARGKLFPIRSAALVKGAILRVRDPEHRHELYHGFKVCLHHRNDGGLRSAASVHC
jgi:hypothetical protein